MVLEKLDTSELRKQFGQRLKTFRESKKMTMEQMGDIIGVKKASIQQLESGKNFPSVENLLLLVDRLGINLLWLLKGEKEEGIKNITEKAIQHDSLFANIYYVSDEAVRAGYLSGLSGSQLTKERLTKIYIPGFENIGTESFLFHVYGESMMPLIASGDMVVAVQIEGIHKVKHGLPYVIYTSEGLVVKRIQKAAEENLYTFISDNEADQEPYDMHIKEVYAIFLVVGVITRNTSKRRLIA
jgi:transcriptional regulator with XRE-family HTH domain